MTIRPPSADSLKSLEQATSRYEEQADQVAEYLAARGIAPSTSERFRLGFVGHPEPGHEPYAGRLAIPSIGPRGVVSLRFRCIEQHSCKEENHGKYMGLPGVPTRIFNSRALHEAGSSIHITEGELDAVILSQCGFAAVGICGANNWQHHYTRVFAGFSPVYVWEDGDEAGRAFSRKVSTVLASARVITLDAGTDVNDLYMNGGESVVREAVQAR